MQLNTVNKAAGFFSDSSIEIHIKFVHVQYLPSWVTSCGACIPFSFFFLQNPSHCHLFSASGLIKKNEQAVDFPNGPTACWT